MQVNTWRARSGREAWLQGPEERLARALWGTARSRERARGPGTARDRRAPPAPGARSGLSERPGHGARGARPGPLPVADADPLLPHGVEQHSDAVQGLGGVRHRHGGAGPPQAEEQLLDVADAAGQEDDGGHQGPHVDALRREAERAREEARGTVGEKRTGRQ